MNSSWAKWLTVAPTLVVTLWLAAVGVEIANIAVHTTTPPFYDALAYAEKARSFWSGLGRGVFENPLNLPPASRAPGTIVLAYPFGYTPAFQWYYFRLAYIPLVFLAGAIYIAGYAPILSRTTRWLLASMALAIAGMPAFYQFQPAENDTFHIIWRSVFGLVDGYLAGVAALAMGAAIRSARLRSTGWAIAAALIAAFCLFIKPTGLVVMALVGAGWVILVGFDVQWSADKIRHDTAVRNFVFKSLAAAIAIYAVAVTAAFHSAYISPVNMAYQNRGLTFLQTEYHAPLNPAFLTLMVHQDLSFTVPIVILLGLLVALIFKPGRGAGITAALCIVGGLWLLVVESDPSEIRYFVPFAAMGFVAVAPALLAYAERIPPRYVQVGAALVMLSPLAIAILLALPHPPPAWQNIAGISLPNDAYDADGKLADDLISELHAAGVKQIDVYRFGNTAALYTFAAALTYRDHVTGAAPEVRLFTPIDWVSPSAFQFDQILQSEYVVFEPIHDEKMLAEILDRHVVPDIWAETKLMNAWFSTLTDADGVKRVAETNVRLLRILDPGRLEASLIRLKARYAWPDSFYAANSQRWWSGQEMAQLRTDQPSTAVDIGFQSAAPDGAAESAPAERLDAVEIDHAGGGLKAKFWVQASNAAPTTGWYLFAHLVNAGGEILDYTGVELLTPPTAERNIHQYILDFPNRPKEAVAIAFGFYKPENDTVMFLSADGGRRDWNGLRVLFPLSNP